MRDNDTQELLRYIEIASESLTLDKSLIEKDYFVTQGIHLLSQVENDYFQLVFCGGTALAKAHKLLQRMSEDCDFKIQAKDPALSLSKSQLLKQLKQFREDLLSTLEKSHLTISHTRVRNEGRYLTVHVDYPSVFPVNAGLRPHMLLEFTYSNARLPIERKEVSTLIEDALPNVTLMDRPTVSVISVEETAAEKWVALTRKISAIERGHYPDDPTLVRHIYDLMSIQRSGKIQDHFFSLAPSIVDQDAQQFKGQHPEYIADPISEIQRSLAILREHPHWQKRYHEFKESMIYGESTSSSYQDALEQVGILSATIISSMQQSTQNCALDQEKNVNAHASDTLPAMLIQYVAMELHQTALMQVVIPMDDPEYDKKCREAKAVSMAYHKELTSFALEVVTHPEIQTVIDSNKEVCAEVLADRGGYAAIHQRFEAGEYLPEDIKSVVKSIKYRTDAYKRKQQELSRDRSRGGRSQ